MSASISGSTTSQFRSQASTNLKRIIYMKSLFCAYIICASRCCISVLGPPCLEHNHILHRAGSLINRLMEPCTYFHFASNNGFYCFLRGIVQSQQQPHSIPLKSFHPRYELIRSIQNPQMLTSVPHRLMYSATPPAPLSLRQIPTISTQPCPFSYA